MKKLICILLLLCCIGVMLTCVACTPGTGTNPGEGEGEGTGDNGQNTTPGMQMFDENGVFLYKLIRQDTNSSYIKQAFIDLRKAVDATFGIKVEFEDDWAEVREYEILVGMTNRPESAQVAEGLADYTYKIEVVGKKIVIVGKDDKATAAGVQYFMSTYLTDVAKITETLSATGEYEPHPLDIVLKDASTGKSNPRVVTTKYPTEDVVVADIIPTEDGYAVSNNGMGDSTAGIQKALNDCAKNGGGTVYLPAGVYAVSGKIQIPPYVTLRGDWQDPDTGSEYGTVIFIYQESKADYAANAEVFEGTFMLGGSGGVLGLTVYYPEQSLDDVKPYPYTFYTNGSGNNYMLSTVKNVTILNGYRGLGACCQSNGGAHEQLTVENFKGTFLYVGAEVYNQADVGTWQDVVISNKYWKQVKGDKMQAADGAKLDAYTKENAVGLMLGDLEWTEFESLKVSDCKIGIRIVPGKRIQFAGSLLDIEILNCGKGLVIDELDRRWGMVIANSTIENGIYNESFKNNAGGEPGLVKLCNVKVTGEKKGEISEDASQISQYVIDYKKTYVKPNANLFVANLDNTGKTDVTAALQAILDEAAATGGVVYLPGGRYRFDGRIVVPAGVELRGSSSIATRDQGWECKGTLLLCYYGDGAGFDAVTDEAFITLNGDYAGLNGVRIVYPNNGPRDPNLNTTYAVRGKGKGVYLVNASIAAAAYGVDFSGCDEHFIKKVTTCCYYNTFLLGGKNGMLSGCLQNGTVIARCAIPERQNWIQESSDELHGILFAQILGKYGKYIILSGAENETIYNTFAYGSETLITCNDNSTAVVANIGCDNVGGYGLYGSSKSPMIVMNSGDLTIINMMRWNGTSYQHNGGTLKMYNRITINIKNEATYNQSK